MYSLRYPVKFLVTCESSETVAAATKWQLRYLHNFNAQLFLLWPVKAVFLFKRPLLAHTKLWKSFEKYIKQWKSISRVSVSIVYKFDT
jgi:hypothetical protein